MKLIARTLVASLLAVLARMIIRKYRPTVVMVTGSVGKTSTKDAVAAALSAHTKVRKSEKSYNSEFGLPLTVIGAKNPWDNPSLWLRVIRQGFALWLLPSVYPKLLVLEVGADRPGDLARILRIATPDLTVVTKLPEVPVHVEAYATPQAVREEEFAPAYALPPGAPLIISMDDSYAREMAAPLRVSVTTYGFSEGADVRLGRASVKEESGVPVGMESIVTVRGDEHMLHARGALGRQQLYAPAAALAAALALNVPVATALKGLASYVPPPGRSRLLRGKEGAILIDDSYNASPAAVEEALNALSLIPGKRRIAILGDMLELGRYSREEHERIGTLAAEACDIVVGVGQRARVITEAARAAGKSEDSARTYDDSLTAAPELAELIGNGDVVLVKGSQSIRTERIVEALLRHPEDVAELVRQDVEWKRR